METRQSMKKEKKKTSETYRQRMCKEAGQTAGEMKLVKRGQTSGWAEEGQKDGSARSKEVNR